MISINAIDYLKVMAELEVNIISGGILFLIIEGDTITWGKSSEELKLDIFKVGEVIKSNSVAARAMKEKKTLIENVPRSTHGIRLKTVSIPLINDANDIVGAFSISIPRLHPLIKAFPDFAPILSEMFLEGVILYATDLHKIVMKQSSNKFDIASVRVGNTLPENSIALKSMKEKKSVEAKVNASVYGVPVFEACYPLFDEDNENEVVGSFVIMVPKEIEASLRKMSENLKTGLSGIASTVEELAASASSIHSNEKELNNEIKGIVSFTEEINKVSNFIKEIADETTMLGLNAAIEAARAGEAGKGFGVVAQEIRKLSDQSKSAVPKIRKLTDSITSKVDEVTQKSLDSLSSSQEQAAATEEITASVEEITAMSEELNKIAHKL